MNIAALFYQYIDIVDNDDSSSVCALQSEPLLVAWMFYEY